MRNWSIPIGKLFGVEIRVHLTFVFLLGFVWMAESSMKTNNAPSPSTPGRVLGLMGIIFGAVVLHELGHALIAAREGIRAKAIILLPIGGIMLREDPPPAESASGKDTWKREILIALAGPLVNFGIALIGGILVLAKFPEAHLWTKPFVHSNHLLRTLVWTNLSVGLFNLLPAYPMDGGHILRALFSRKMDMVSATRRAVSIAHALAMLVIVLGMLLLFEGGYPDSYLVVAMGFFLLIGAQVEERTAVFQKVLETVHLEDVMLTDFATLSPADTLEDALEKAVHTLQDDFPVVRGGDMVGVISKANILDALRMEGNGYVQSVMNRIFEVSSRQESLAAAFRKLNSRNLSIIPGVEDQRLVGIITLQNLMHSMALLAESRKLRKEALNS
ncbi:MAG TPA: site-2 protease family protein [Terriglobales bacterium]|nr:site-2 protease family protein [Terriglobales bacterium]